MQAQTALKTRMSAIMLSGGERPERRTIRKFERSKVPPCRKRPRTEALFQGTFEHTNVRTPSGRQRARGTQAGQTISPVLYSSGQTGASLPFCHWTKRAGM